MFNYQISHLNRYGQNVGAETKTPAFFKFPIQPMLGRWVKVIPFAEIEDEPNIFRTLWRAIEREDNDKAWTYLPYERFTKPEFLENSIRANFGYSYGSQYVVQVGHQTLGWLGLINPRLEDRIIEIGNVFFSDQLKQTTAATEAIFLVLEDCFNHGFRKVEWRCNDLNEAGINAAVRFGFLYEGTLRQDKVIKGLNCNTACFSILDEEWKLIRLAFLDWLKQDNFDIERQQKVALEEFMKLYPLFGREEDEAVLETA